jgi:uncharacterized membrane protein
MSVSSAPPAPAGRIRAIDVARGVALLAMAIYHFTWDLEFFGYLAPATTAVGGWKLFARCIAASFLFLVGVSLVLAHSRGIRWRPFLMRIAMVAGAAMLITLATFLATPHTFIFFGILHQIALASLLGLLVLRMPAAALVLLAAVVIALPNVWRSDVFNAPWLWWVGLSSTNPPSNDYVPLFPWFGAVLLGMAGAKIATRVGLLDRLRPWTPPASLRLLEIAGQHSLAVYLIHQPVLIGLIWLGSQIVPPPAADPATGFTRACQIQCVQSRDEAFCTRYCGCMLDLVENEGGVERLDHAAQDPAIGTRLQEIALQCSTETDLELFEGLPDE